MTDVSIIIVNYNTKEHLIKCLESVFRQNKDIKCEVFVIDNGSTDGSADAVQQSYPSINLIRNERNNGFARAVNQGLKRATNTRYYLILNSDAILSDDYLKRLVEFLDTHQESAIVTGQLLDLDGSRQHSFDNFPNLLGELVGKSLLRIILPKKYPSKRQIYAEPINVESVIGAAFLVRQKAVENVGSFDEDYFFFLEETDWCYRMRQKGWMIHFVPDVIAYHLQGQTKKSVQMPAKIEYLNSMYIFFRKHYHPITYWLLRIIKPCKTFLGLLSNLLICLLTLCLVKKFRRAVMLYSVIIFWHLTLCSEKMTLKYISQNK